MDSDVIVIGAGIAGLAAAGELARQGLRVTVLEARNRIGGRIWSIRPRGWPGPVELGAEFIHGSNSSLKNNLTRARLRSQSTTAVMWWRDAQGLRQVPDFWERIGRVADRIPARDRGWSFVEFLDLLGPKIPSEDRAMAEHYVGGFNAGALESISAHALRAQRAGTEEDDFKIAGRYDAVAQALRQQWPKQRVTLHLRSIATAIRWRPGAVTVSVRRVGFRKLMHATAPLAVITLPLGVLQAGRVMFTPPLRAKQRLIAKLGWGRAVRVTIRFRRGFWLAPFLPNELGARRGRAFGFLNAPGEPLPVWWALTPPAPVLTGWAGGEAARPVASHSRRSIIAAAVRSLASIFTTTQKNLRAWILDAQTHPWDRDPFALGAYSFAAAGYDDGPAQLAQPIASTLFFAGEATSEDVGTVHGALESGLRVAKEVISARQRG